VENELDSQLAVIQAGQWQEAVFTTYALSLTFFESCLLPALRKARCEKATIFTDIDGYRSSLMERRSASAGREYAVVPVQVGTGIFHPKCTYLFGEAFDALLVGSGNVTFGGHGKNVEVLEILFSDANPRCFIEFADFIASVLLRGDVYVPEKGTLERLAQRARYAGRRKVDSTPDAVELIHSTEQSIQVQLQERAPSAVKHVIVLSPYHHPTGEPIRDLLKATGAKKLMVGVPSDGSPTSFPLFEAKDWGVPFQCVRPDVANRKRGLHAKWWEIRGQSETLTLTGSVNATRESFATTNNIEVGIVRRSKKSVPNIWKEVEQPAYKKDEFYKMNVAGVGAIYATVDGEGRVKGRILGIEDPAGQWDAQMEEGPTVERQVLVNGEGFFSWRDSKLLTVTRTLQLELLRGTDVARGWLGNEAILRMPSRARAVAQAVVRMLTREETADDVEALFDYIATETAAALADAPTRLAQPTLPVKPLVDEEVIARSELDYAGSSAEEHLLSALATNNASRPEHRLTILDSIAAILLGQSSGTSGAKGSSPKPGKPVRGDASEDDDENASQTARQEALDRFNGAMENNLASAKVSGRLLAIAMRIWLNVNLDMQLRRLGSPEAAWLYARTWVAHVRKTRLDEQIRAMLAEAFCGLAGGLLVRAMKSNSADSAVSDIALTPRDVHDWMDMYFDGAPILENIMAYAGQWMDHDLAQSMIQGDRAAALRAIETAMATPTARQIVTDLVAAREIDKQIVVPEKLFTGDVEKLIARIQSAPQERPIHRVVKGGLPAACSCYVTLIPDTLTRLRKNRVAECMNCHAVILWLGSNHEAR